MRAAPQMEICIDTVTGLNAAIASGADRIELCSALALGGLTPGPGLIAAAAQTTTPCHAMIRPRAGDFVLRAGELATMLDDIAAIREAGLAGVVIGVALPDGTLDRDALRKLCAAASGLCVTLHRVFDLTPNADAALDCAIELGINRILTSGQAATAQDGAEMLARLVARAAGRIEIMAGGGVTAQAAPALMATGVDALHSSCSQPDKNHTEGALLELGANRITNQATVTALRAAMAQQELCA